MELNLNSLTTDDRGRVSFSGLGSKIDFKGAVDAIIKAKRIPVDRLEARITENDERIASYQEFRSLLNGLRDSLKNLYGAVSIDRSKNIFEAKQAYASASRADGGTASAPAEI
ncbi:MAG TPA: flagellar cap protein FliD N-terminal domain-containing protein, partial [Sphingomicrobium sp.]|nr:flagellar cap protein FliD N-terminal domain-containing protein [Sphingomicrobium sp.]